MSIIPAALLSGAELAMLGNNVTKQSKRRASAVAAVNRSLRCHGDAVSRLHRHASSAPRLPKRDENEVWHA